MHPVTEKLISDLAALGIRRHNTLLVHASLRSLGKLPQGPETVIQALIQALGERGTLLLPALSYESVQSAHPFFDVRQTPSCVGALPEYFRRREGTLRSVHPTHSVCGVGYEVHTLLGGHEKDTTPCGLHSPFHKLPAHNGQILFIGCGLRPNTCMHAIEELIEPPYLFADEVDYEITHADRHITMMRVRRHNFKGWVQRYDRIERILPESALKKGKVLEADCYLIEASKMWSEALEKMKEDALFFVDKERDVP